MKRLKLSLEWDSAALEESQKLTASASQMSSFGLMLENLMESKTIVYHGKLIGDEDSFLIVQFSALSKLFLSLSCPHCFQSGLTFKLLLIRLHGFGSTGTVRCPSSNVAVELHLLCEHSDRSVSTKSSFEVNMRAIVAIVAIASIIGRFIAIYIKDVGYVVSIIIIVTLVTAAAAAAFIAAAFIFIGKDNDFSGSVETFFVPFIEAKILFPKYVVRTYGELSIRESLF